MTDTMARISKKSLETIWLNTNLIDESQRGDLSKFTQASVRPRLGPDLLTPSPVLRTRGGIAQDFIFYVLSQLQVHFCLHVLCLTRIYLCIIHISENLANIHDKVLYSLPNRGSQNHNEIPPYIHQNAKNKKTDYQFLRMWSKWNSPARLVQLFQKTGPIY